MAVVVAVVWAEQPAGAAVDELIVGELELGEELIAVWLVNVFPCVFSEDLVLGILIHAVACVGGAVFGEAIWRVFGVFAEDDEFGGFPGLSWAAEVAPEAGFFHVVAASDVEISGCFLEDLGVADFLGWSAHVACAHGVGTLGKEEGSESEGGGLRESHEGGIHRGRW